MRYLLCLLAVTFTLSAEVPSFSPAAAPTDWVATLDRFAAGHPDLSDAQQALVGEGRELLEDGLLAKLHSTDAAEAADAKRALASFKARAKEAFSKELYVEAFVPRCGQRSATRARGMVPYCDCNSYTGECAGDCPVGGCRAMPEGCGMWGTDACFGLCQ